MILRNQVTRLRESHEGRIESSNVLPPLTLIPAYHESHEGRIERICRTAPATSSIKWESHEGRIERSSSSGTPGFPKDDRIS